MCTIHIILISTLLLHHCPLLIHHRNQPIYPTDIIHTERILDCQRNVLLKHPVQEVVAPGLNYFCPILRRPIPVMEQPYRFIHVN